MPLESWKSRLEPQDWKLSQEKKKLLEELLRIGSDIIQEVMDIEAQRSMIDSTDYAQSINQVTGDFRMAEATQAAVRARAFQEVKGLLEQATK